MAALVDKISPAMCERLITAATSHCQAATQAPQPQVIHEPNWEGVTTGLTTLSTVIGWALLVLAILSLLGLIGWVFSVRHWAREEARKAAKEWLNTEGPKILRDAGSLLNPNSDNINSTAAQQEADQLGEHAG